VLAQPHSNVKHFLFFSLKRLACQRQSGTITTFRGGFCLVKRQELDKELKLWYA